MAAPPDVLRHFPPRRIRRPTSDLCGSSLSRATVAEVAEALGISPSTASKVLADLEREGQVMRSAGGNEGGAPLPDRWHLAKGDNGGTSPRRTTRVVTRSGWDVGS